MRSLPTPSGEPGNGTSALQRRARAPLSGRQRESFVFQATQAGSVSPFGFSPHPESQMKKHADISNGEALPGRPTEAESVADDLAHLPPFLTVEQLALLLHKTEKAVHTMFERGLIPGAVRVRRRLLFSRRALVRWLDQNRVPSLEGVRR